MSRKCITLGSAILVLAALAALIIYSPSVCKCIEQQSNGNGAQEYQNIASRMLGFCSLRLTCFFGFFGDYSEGLSAIATIVIAAFTATLWRATTKQWQASNEQNRLLEKQMLFEHGAHIKVVEVELIGHLTVDNPVAGRVCLINVGASDAKIISGNITVTIANAAVAPWRHVESNREVADPYEPPFDFFLNGLLGPIIEAGMQTLPFSRERHMHLNLLESQDIRDGKKAVWLVGFVFYRDSITGRKRKTGFCRQLTEDNTRFRTFADPDLEYEY